MRVKKNCLEMGLLFADEQTLKRRGARPLEGAWREWNDTLGFGPRVEVLSLDEMDRVEAERERAQRCVVVPHYDRELWLTFLIADAPSEIG